MLGHASAAMTLDTYADLFDDDLDAVADRLDEVVGKMWADASQAADYSCVILPLTCAFGECPRQDSNLRTRLRRAVLYPLSYGGAIRNSTSPGGCVLTR